MGTTINAPYKAIIEMIDDQSSMGKRTTHAIAQPIYRPRFLTIS
jgi:hypothetical protein